MNTRIAFVQSCWHRDLVDGTHPDDEGYEKMAQLWFSGIKDAAARGWLEEPQALPEAGGPGHRRHQPVARASAAR